MILDTEKFNPSLVKPSGRSAFTKEEWKDTIVEVPGKPRIIAGNCEFCGILAINCPHHEKKD